MHFGFENKTFYVVFIKMQQRMLCLKQYLYVMRDNSSPTNLTKAEKLFPNACKENILE